MEDAKTQHRQKIAAQLGGLCGVIVEEKWDPDSDGSMKGLLEVVKEGNLKGNIRKVLKEKVKGFGDTGVDIFLRRVQGCEGWEGIGWFVDPRTKESLEEVGLPGDGEQVMKLIEEMGEKDIRRCFQIVSERALGMGLEGKVAEMKDMLK